MTDHSHFTGSDQPAVQFPASNPSPAHVRKLEELSLNAWPSLQQVLYDWWVLRFADGYTRRANSINPLYEGVEDVRTKIRVCEGIYSRRDLAPVFKLTGATWPGELDALLAAAGYQEAGRTSVLVLDLPPEASNEATDVYTTDQPYGEWIDAAAGLNRVPPHQVPAFSAMLHAIAVRTDFAAVVEDGQIRALGLGVVDGGWLGLFDIVTRPDSRNRGFSRRLIQSLLDWGVDYGATRAYLQVMLDNVPARNLYAKIGFQEAYQYWYRVMVPAQMPAVPVEPD